MGTFLLQEKIESLQSMADSLLHIGDNNEYVYADDLSRLNNQIHKKINELYSLRGNTVEQEASLCLSILMGYSVSVYANPEDEIKKQAVLKRAQHLLTEFLPTSLRHQLLTICDRL